MHVAETLVQTTRLYATPYEKQSKAKDLVGKHENHEKAMTNNRMHQKSMKII